MNRQLKWMLLLVLIWPIQSVAEEDAVAMITDISGVSRNISDTPPRQMDIFSQLFVGDQLEIGKQTNMTLVYWHDYRIFQVYGPAVVHIRSNGLEHVSGNKPKIKVMQLRHRIKINPAEVVQSGLVMRSAQRSKPIRLLNLTGVKIAEKQPVFRWKRYRQANERVRFELADEDGNVLLVKVLKGERFKLPDSVHLKEGILYSWSIEGRMENGQMFSDWGDFEIAEPSLVAQKNKLMPTLHADFSQRLLYAAWLQQQGFGDEAQYWWQRLLKERPDSLALQAALTR